MYKSVYFIGIKGVGMTMLAQFLKEKGIKVSGSDVADTFLSDKSLKKSNIKVHSPFSISNINLKADLIVYTSACGSKNIELQFIKENPNLFKKTTILNYAQALALIFNKYQGVAVIGSHGKTTTSAALAYSLNQASFPVNALIGSYVPQFKGSILSNTQSKILIAELDEYQNKLQHFKPKGVLLNNIDYDHPDFFKTKKQYLQVFIDFIKKIPKNGFLVANYDDDLVFKIKDHCQAQIISYGFSKKRKVDFLISNYNLNSFKVNGQTFKIKLFGRHNVLNSTAVIATASYFKVNVKKSLANFKGTDRRSDLIGNYQGIDIYDDYAHHPSEVRACLKSFKERFFSKRLVLVFHPHTFTRTKKFFKEFASSLQLADKLAILEIYGSAREEQGGISSLDLAKAVSSQAKYLKDFQSASSWLKKTLRKNDILLLMGAGDVFRVKEILCRKN
jgi:UDP-N-acetylmuramate--alanine ligase